MALARIGWARRAPGARWEPRLDRGRFRIFHGAAGRQHVSAGELLGPYLRLGVRIARAHSLPAGQPDQLSGDGVGAIPVLAREMEWAAARLVENRPLLSEPPPG